MLVLLTLVMVGCGGKPVERDTGAPDWYDSGGERGRPESGDSGDGGGDDTHVSHEIDEDGDGFVPADGDCDDGDPTINPGAEEVCDGRDNDCNGEIDEGAAQTFYADADGDGFGDARVAVEACVPPDNYVAGGTDCDDDNAAIYPGATEECDGADNDCDGQIDEICEG